MAVDKLVVRDVLIPIEQYPHLNENKSLHDAIKVVQSFTEGKSDRLKYAELLVVSDACHVVGKVTIVDILYGMAPRLAMAKRVEKFEGKGSSFPNLAILLEDTFLKECSMQLLHPIKNFMKDVGEHVKVDTSMLKALMIMLNSQEYNLPVVDGDQIIGVIRLEEIFSEMYDHCIAE
jgi:predicted transcriptional regulator